VFDGDGICGRESQNKQKKSYISYSGWLGMTLLRPESILNKEKELMGLGGRRKKLN